MNCFILLQEVESCGKPYQLFHSAHKTMEGALKKMKENAVDCKQIPSGEFWVRDKQFNVAYYSITKTILGE